MSIKCWQGGSALRHCGLPSGTQGTEQLPYASLWFIMAEGRNILEDLPGHGSAWEGQNQPHAPLNHRDEYRTSVLPGAHDDS